MSFNIPQTLAIAQNKFNAGQFDEAANLFDDILLSDPEQGDALEGLAYIAAQKGEHERAADYLARASTRLSMPVQRLHMAGEICQAARRHQDALAFFQACLARAPNHAASMFGAVVSLVQLGEPQQALQALARLRQAHPRSADVHYNCGVVLGEMDRFEEEVACYKAAIALKPDFARAHANLGTALCELHRFDEALKQFKKALSIDPNEPGARFVRAQTNLALGEFEHGWREYEWRWQNGMVPHGFPQASLWTGVQPIAGKTLLVHHEQGLGDTLQFVRFAGRPSGSGARVVLRVQDPLLDLLRHFPGTAEVIGESAPLPPYDFHVPLLSLPFALKLREPDLAMAGPYLQADAQRVARWAGLLAQAPKRPRVGIAWSGSPTHKNDRKRSMPLTQLDPLFDAFSDGRVDFVSLHKVVRPADRERFDRHVGRAALRDVSEELATFSDTAALIEHLDLVISVDTAVAHLAGALGKPVWLALQFTPDWRWQMHRRDSPWYPGVKLFRQSADTGWADVVAELRRELEAWSQAWVGHDTPG